jgi:cytochrome c-type biogenesis protein CcmH/NrfG
MIISTTLVGPGTLELLDDALASVRHAVDLSLVISTTAEVTLPDVKHSAQRAGLSKAYAFAEFPWVNDFAAARNFALETAAKLGGTWALGLDTDERYSSDPKALRALLEATKASALYVSHASGSYTQARLVSLPCAIRYSGRTHEAFPAYQVPTELVPRAVLSWRDEPKSPEQLEEKFRRDLAILEEETAAHPDQTRWFFYLGETRRNLGDLPGAISAYERCAALRGWNEESAWACYRAAECSGTLKLWSQAIEFCCKGLDRDASVGELAWLAGFACYQLGRYHDALAWSAMASASSVWSGVGRESPRIGFSHPPARYELPHQLMACCWDKLDRPMLAKVARAKEEQAFASRLHEATAT